MDGEHLGSIAVLVGSFSLVIFFTAAEAAFSAVNRMAILTEASNGNHRAEVADQLLEARDQVVADLLVGINVFTVLSSVLSASLTEDLFGSRYLSLSAAALTLLVLIFAEMVPKAICYADPTGAALRLTPGVRLASSFLRPVTLLISVLPRWLARRVGEPEDQLEVTDDSLAELVRIGEEQGELDPDTGDVITGIMASQDETAKNVMIPLDEATIAPVNTPLRSLAALMSQTGFSRIPLYQGDRRSIIGVVHVKDVFARLYRGGSGTARDLVRPILRTQPGRTSVDLLSDMRSRRQHIAVVDGPDGLALGLVTIQDLLEDIVGEVKDEQPAPGAAGGNWIE